MIRSIIIPVGSSDIDGPDFIILPWDEQHSNLYTKRSQSVRRLAKGDNTLTCCRYVAAEALGFFTPAEDSNWLQKLDTMHIENSVLMVPETTKYFLKRWKGFHIPMPDRPRVSFYASGGIFFSGPIDLSALRWETSCGIRIGRGGSLESVPKEH